MQMHPDAIARLPDSFDILEFCADTGMDADEAAELLAAAMDEDFTPAPSAE